MKNLFRPLTLILVLLSAWSAQAQESSTGQAKKSWIQVIYGPPAAEFDCEGCKAELIKTRKDTLAESIKGAVSEQAIGAAVFYQNKALSYRYDLVLIGKQVVPVIQIKRIDPLPSDSKPHPDQYTNLDGSFFTSEEIPIAAPTLDPNTVLHALQTLPSNPTDTSQASALKNAPHLQKHAVAPNLPNTLAHTSL